jgi:hypothetical protein
MSTDSRVLSQPAQEVLASILSLGTDLEFDELGLRCQPPSADDLFALCELLAKHPPEEELQNFLIHHPGFLMGLFGTSDAGDLALVAKPRIGVKYVADFGIVQVNQGGAGILLVEIETSHEAMFTASFSPARRLQSALTQVDGWREWLSANKLTFCRDTLDRVCRLPLYDGLQSSVAGYRFGDADRMRQMWGSFGGLEEPNIRYSIVAGRWGLLSLEERRRFISKFGGDSDLSVFTFDQLARQANYRGERNY